MKDKGVAAAQWSPWDTVSLVKGRSFQFLCVPGPVRIPEQPVLGTALLWLVARNAWIYSTVLIKSKCPHKNTREYAEEVRQGHVIEALRELGTFTLWENV